MSPLYVGTLPDGTDVKLDVWPDGTHEVAVRDMESRRWGIPVALTLETLPESTRRTHAELIAEMTALTDAEADRKMIAGLRGESS